MAAFGAARYGHMGEKQQSKSPIRLEGYTTTERRMQEKIVRRLNFFPQRTIGRTQTSCQTASMTSVRRFISETI